MLEKAIFLQRDKNRKLVQAVGVMVVPVMKFYIWIIEIKECCSFLFLVVFPKRNKTCPLHFC